MLRALDARLRHPDVSASSSSSFATLLPGEPFDLPLVGGFDRSLLGQGPIGHGIVGRSVVILVVRGLGTSNRATAPQGGNCVLPDADI
jgi:hypothetical protein